MFSIAASTASTEPRLLERFIGRVPDRIHRTIPENPINLSPWRCVGLFHRHRILGSTILVRRLPELDSIAFQVGDPCEPAVLTFLDLPLELDPSFAEGSEDSVQILHAVVDHEGRAALAEVVRPRRKDRPERVALALPILAAPPGEERHGLLDLNPQVPAVPLDESFRILRLEENASDACDSGSKLSWSHARE